MKYRMTVSEKKYRKRMSPKSGLGEKIIEYGILGLIIFSPLPAASVHEWSILVIQLAVVVMMIAYFMMKEQPETNEPLSYSMRWPGYLFIGLFIFIFIQVIPLPKILVSAFSPSAYSFREAFSAEFAKVEFISFSLMPSRTLKSGLELLTYFLLGFLIIKTVTRRRQIRKIISLLVIMGVFEALYGFFELYRTNPRILFYKKVYGLDSVTGTFVNRNHLSGYLEMIIPLAIGLIIARADLFSLAGMRWREKILHLTEKGFSINLILTVSLIIMSMAVLFSRSRAGIILLVFTFILLIELVLIHFGRDRPQQRFSMNFLTVTFLIITLLSLYIGIGATIERFSVDKLLQEGRPLYWSNVSTIIGDFPLFGIGLGSFASFYPAYEKDVELDYGRLSHAHNDYLEYFSELGLVGGILLIGGILFMTVNSFLMWRERRHPEIRGLALGGIIAVVCILIHSITDFNLHIPANMLLFSVVLSLTVATVFYQKS